MAKKTRVKKGSVTTIGTFNEMVVKVHSFGFDQMRKASGISTDVGDKQGVDPFEELYVGTGNNKGNLIKPPYDPLMLARMGEVSDVLPQCVESYAVNVGGFGWDLRRVEDPSELDTDKPSPEAILEKKKLTRFFNYINGDEDLTKLRKKTRQDYEYMGMGYWEVVRSRMGDLSELHILPSHSMRLVAPTENPVKYEQNERDENGNIVKVTRKKRFGGAAQRTFNNKVIYFKEFGDPRKISSKTGFPLGKDSKGPLANEVIIFKEYSSYSNYGLPRWLGVSMVILGARKAEEINFLFFDNKTIPPLIITVSGGALTNETIEKLKDMFDKELKGIDNFHKALIIEATPHSTSEIAGEKVTPVRIDVKPLTDMIQKDAMFINYRDSARKRVRSAFRLPPIFTGDSDDYTKATAYMSAIVTENQVFEPERRDFDDQFNRTVMMELGAKHWVFKSLGSNMSDYTELVKALGMVKEAIPVGEIQEAVKKMLNKPIGHIDDELYIKTLAEHLADLVPDPIPLEESSDKPGDEDDKKDKDNKDKEKENKLIAKIKKMVEDAVVDQFAREGNADGNSQPEVT